MVNFKGFFRKLTSESGVEKDQPKNSSNGSQKSSFFSIKTFSVTNQNSENINLTQLSEWIKQQESDILDQQNLNLELTNYVNQLKAICWKLDQQLNQWQEQVDFSKLQYTTVGELNTLFSDAQTVVKLLGTKHIITLKNVFVFNNLLKDKSDKVLEKIKNSSLSEELSNLLVMEPQEQISDEDQPSNPLVGYLEDINRLREHFDTKMRSCGWQRVNSLFRLYNSLAESTQNPSRLQERLKVNQHHLKLTLENVEEKDKELSSLSKEQGYDALEQREAKLSEVSPKFEEVREKVLLFFSPLKPFLDKFKDTDSGEALLDDYVYDYMAAFNEDEDLAILSILRKMYSAIENGKIKADTKDKALVNERVEKANSGELRDLHREYRKLKKEILFIEQAGTDRALLMKVEDLRYRLEHFKQEELRIRKTIREIEEETNTTKNLLFKTKEKIEVLAQEHFGKDISVEIN